MIAVYQHKRRKEALCQKVVTLAFLLASWSVSSFCYALELAPLPDFSKNPQPKITLFTIAGSNTIGAKLGPALVRQYLADKGLTEIQEKELATNEKEIVGLAKQQNKSVAIVVKAHGSSSGFKAIAAGKADIAAASRSIKDKEHKLLSSKGDFKSDTAEHILAIDGLAIIVNQSNPLKQLSVEQVGRLFTGNISSWSQIGGAPLKVICFARDDASGTWDTFNGLVLKKQSLVAGTERFESNAELARKVAASSGAIGFVGLNSIGNAKPLAISAGGDNYLEPNLLNVATEDYPLGRRLYFYVSPNTPSTLAKEFVEYALSAKGQEIVNEAGFVGQNIAMLNQQLAAKFPADYIEQVKGYRRLSVNFRFQIGKAKLDNKGNRDLKRMKAFYEQQRKNGPVSFIVRGFAEEAGNAKKTELLANLRAKVVKRELIKAGLDRNSLKVIGYGALHLTQSNNDPATKVKNSRVEVWLKSSP
ncbi:phosphate ABC transporter substrate-binding/OmpA family protein [Spartinivicinus poritis]|uniref:Phosphate ABC transporter substrate-binding/OmpA family protein n=1 Tax=Spartinivicinus poritis TaxID=2994640 RepID=A0ABT5UC59_9GAMM|nr:phosphate ABC transporter substrate-binding/OmpA family protein [Spartinivicinus sp. A2-2]MDE1463961.1 phosphate ABC transporter substrate-binding/OmpA family protein [Spartinivicinus sp. A2-2]